MRVLKCLSTFLSYYNFFFFFFFSIYSIYIYNNSLVWEVSREDDDFLYLSRKKTCDDVDWLIDWFISSFCFHLLGTEKYNILQKTDWRCDALFIIIIIMKWLQNKSIMYYYYFFFGYQYWWFGLVLLSLLILFFCI